MDQTIEKRMKLRSFLRDSLTHYDYKEYKNLERLDFVRIHMQDLFELEDRLANLERAHNNAISFIKGIGMNIQSFCKVEEVRRDEEARKE